MKAFFLGLLMLYIFMEICNGFIKYNDNLPVMVSLVFIFILYSVFFYEYIIWFSSWYSVNF